MAFTTSVLTGWPARAPSRSTTWTRRAPGPAEGLGELGGPVGVDGAGGEVAPGEADHLAVHEVDGGDDEHGSEPHEPVEERQPHLLALLGVELDGEEVPAGQPGAVGAAVLGERARRPGRRPGPRRSGRSRRTGRRAGRRAGGASPPPAPATSRCSGASPLAEGGPPSRGRCPGRGAPPASSPSSKRTWSPTQMPSIRAPRASASTSASATPRGPHGLGAGRHRPLPGHDDAPGPAHHLRVAGDEHLGPHLAQRVLHRPEVARAVVDERDGALRLTARPSWTGSRPPRGAGRRAGRGPSDLKMASTTWWRFRPWRTFTWSVMRAWFTSAWKKSWVRSTS